MLAFHNNMPRKIVPISKVHPYHIGGRCHNKDWYYIPIEDVWKIFEDYLNFIHHNYNIEIFSFVLMSNHFHLLLKAPDGNLSTAMRYLMCETSRQINRLAKRINQVYGSRFHRTLIHNHQYYLSAYKYVYRNPVKAKICQKPEDYRYSTLSTLIGRTRSIIPIAEDLTLFSDPEGTMKWLNTEEEETNYESVRKALRKSVFEFAKKRDGSPYILTQNRY